MKALFNYFFAFVILIVWSCDVKAQTIRISAEIRPRYEFRNGYKTLKPDDARPANFISQRTRLNAYYGNQLIKAYLSIQDVRVWGDVSQLNVQDANGFGVHEAWAEIRIIEQLGMKIGRQEVAYDDERIFGAVGWAQQARSHDALMLKYAVNSKHNIDFGFGYNALRESNFREDYTLANYKTIQWLHYLGSFNNSGLSILFLNNGLAYDSDPDPDNSEEKIAYSQTVGARYNVGIKKIKADAAFYFQGGKNGSNRNLSAYYLSANVTAQATDIFNIGIGLEYLSGTSTENQGQANTTDHSFNPFYGTNHKFNGWMDYFYVGNYNGRNGLVDIYLPLMFKIKQWNFGLRPHYFIAAAKVSSFNENNQTWQDFGNGLGTELDLVIGYGLSDMVNFTGGYSQMLATETMQVVKYPENTDGAFYKNNNSWAWIMITISPTFFSKE